MTAARPDGPRSPRLLYLGVAGFVLLVGFTAVSVEREWKRQAGQSRAEAVFQLVQGTAPTRPTDSPGASAWLLHELARYARLLADRDRSRLFGDVVGWRDTASVPPVFEPLRRLLATPLAAAAGGAPPLRVVTPAELGEPPEASASPVLTLRRQLYLALEEPATGETDGAGLTFVVTRRRGLDAEAGAAWQPAADPFLAAALPHLGALAAEVRGLLARAPLPALPEERPPVLVRLYALSEDGTLVTLPLPLATEAGERRRATLAEGRELRKLPQQPTFVSNEFFFRFDFRHPVGVGGGAQCFYSGPYLDVGGQGLVATLTVPKPEAPGGAHWLAGIDLKLDIDWSAFARRIEPPLVAAAVEVEDPPLEVHRPWGRIGDALGAGSPSALPAAVAALAEPEPRGDLSPGQPYVLHGVAPGHGALAAFQVAATTWLVVLFPRTASHLPVVPVLLSAASLALLLAGFERNRRRAERAQAKAEGELAEKQNLLNTMQVPLIVVDPNTDVVVSSNRAATSLGVEPGSRVADLVDAEPRAREHYHRMQVAGEADRRAYGVPVRVRGESGGEERRYAVVRSVAVTAPIEALGADERHRLGILFLLDPEADLALLTEELEASTRLDERRRLAGLLTHGVDTLVRVLAHGLSEGGGERPDRGAAALNAWLAGYLDQRIATTCWLLDHWDAEPPLAAECSVEPAQARATFERLASVLEAAAADAELRSRLHWDNGTLAGRPHGGPCFRFELDWPEGFWLPCPVRGGFGFFLSEVLANAVRHGRPGTTPRLSIALDRVRRELAFEVCNELEPMRQPAAGGAGQGDSGDGYSGRRLLARLARLFGWQDLAFVEEGGSFRVSWRTPVGERGEPQEAD